MNRIRSKSMFCGLIVCTLNACGQATTTPKAEATPPVSRSEKTAITPIKGAVVFYSDEYNATVKSFNAARADINALADSVEPDNPDRMKILKMQKSIQLLPGRVSGLHLLDLLVEAGDLETNAQAMRVYAAYIFRVVKVNQELQGKFLTDSLSGSIPGLKPIGSACFRASHDLGQVLDKDLSGKLANLGMDHASFKGEIKMEHEVPLAMETVFLASLKNAMPDELKRRYDAVIATVKPLAISIRQLRHDCEMLRSRTQHPAYGLLGLFVDDTAFRSVDETMLPVAMAMCADEAHRAETFRKTHLILNASIAGLDNAITGLGLPGLLEEVTPEIAKQARQLSADIAALKGKLEEMQQYFAE